MKLSLSLLLTTLLFFNVSAQNFDINVLKDIQSTRTHKLDIAFENFSKSTYPVSAAVPLGMLGVGLITKDKNLQQQGIASVAALAVSMGTTYVLKKAIDRPRPSEKYPFIQPYVVETGPSIPSGHTTAAFSAATSLCLAVPKWYVIVPAYAWASTVAYSRMHLGVHYPTDVLAGAVIGAGSAWATHRINKWLQKKR